MQLKLTALMTIILVGVVQAIVVSVANVNSWNAVAVIAREQITEARPTLRLAITRRLVTSVQAIIVSVAVPSSWNAPGKKQNEQDI